MFSWIKRKLKGVKLNLEPVAVGHALTAVVAVASTYGFKMSPEQLTNLIVAYSALVGILVRSKVTPVKKDSVDPDNNVPE